LKIDIKLPLKNLKLKKKPKTQAKNPKNSSKKLRVREALTYFLYPSDVKIKPALSTGKHHRLG